MRIYIYIYIYIYIRHVYRRRFRVIRVTMVVILVF